MADIFEKVKNNVHIAEVVSLFGVQLNSNDKGLCPFHSEKTPSFSVDRKTNIFTCFGCGATGDVIAFVSKIKNIEPIEAAKFLAETYHVDIDEGNKPGKFDIKAYLKKCIADVGQTDYFKRRGLTAATVKKYCLGYDVYHRSAVIPYSSALTYYQTRSVVDKKFYKPKTEDAGAEPLFNGEIMYKSKSPVFVVESPICALSIMQCGHPAIALCGVGNINKLVHAVKNKKPTATLILALDNDDAGKKASGDLAAMLLELNVQYDVYNIAGECKDPNELLLKNKSQLERNLKAAKTAAKKKYATAKDSFTAAELQDEEVAPPTWIVDGMLPTGLALLCAPSKLGKSWMMLQLCMAVAEGNEFLGYATKKCECLYYALEDSKARLKDRMQKMLKGKRAPSGVHFALDADPIDNGFMERVVDEIKTYPNIKLVIIDTLQKVRGKPSSKESMYSIDYREMGELKRFADKNHITMLFVHHLRKMADESDVYNMISGSTALMGAADTVFVISKKKRTDEDATMSMTGRDIEQSSIVVQFNKYDYLWEVRGTAEEVEAKKERQEYENSPIVITIKELIKRNPMGGWKGSAAELMKAVYDVTGKKLAESATGVGKLISKYEYRLHCDDIEHTVTRSATRTHTFKRIVRNMPYGYQRTIYDGEND